MNLLAFAVLVQRFASAARASAGVPLDFTVGSVFRALAEASAAVALWLQWLIVQVLAATRLATSQGSDVDTFVGDFGLTRLPAVGATGQITFSRNAPGLLALIPVGALVKSVDGTQVYAVTLDTTNAAYDPLMTGYVIQPAALSVTLPAAASGTGAASNALPGVVNVLSTSIAGIDSVTNTLAFTGGIDAEPDAALRSRFALYIQGLSKGTASAIGYAIVSVKQGLTYSLAVGVDTTGATRPGNIVITVDDGSGAPPASLLSAIYTSVDAVRSAGETFSVQPPTVISVAISMVILPAPGYVKTNLQGPVAAAVTSFVNGLGIGSPLYYTRLAQVSLLAAPGIASITGLTINGAQGDVIPSPSGSIKATTVAVN